MQVDRQPALAQQGQGQHRDQRKADPHHREHVEQLRLVV